jgi:diguanylate cyclase (GGDEF)-like protein
MPLSADVSLMSKKVNTINGPEGKLIRDSFASKRGLPYIMGPVKKLTKTTYFYLAAAIFPLIASVFQAQGWGSLPDAANLDKVPWVALAVLGFLGWRLNQTRILFSALLLLHFYYVLGHPLEPSPLGLSPEARMQVAALSLPYSLLLLFAMREAPLFSQRSLLRLLLAGLPLAIAAGLATAEPVSFKALVAWQPLPFPALKLPEASALGLLAFSALAFFYKDPKVGPFLGALAFALLPLSLAFDSVLRHGQFHSDTSFRELTLAFSCGSGILLWAIFSMYWQRVYLDELTGIANRRALDEKLATLDTGYALAMVDIDHFKKFNDTYGHEEGDNVLRLVARHLADGSGGRAYRYGGEEFCLVFEEWSLEKARDQADGIRKALAAREFSIRMPGKMRKKTSAGDRGSLHAKSAVQVTVSLGVAGPDKKRRYAHEVIKLADDCLYEAKKNGRNCVVCLQEPA